MNATAEFEDVAFPATLAVIKLAAKLPLESRTTILPGTELEVAEFPAVAPEATSVEDNPPT